MHAPNRLLVMVVLHKEGVRHVELPDLVLAAELRALAEHALARAVVLPVPVDGRHGHQACNSSRVCVYVCVRMREGEGEGERESVCVCVTVCVSAPGPSRPTPWPPGLSAHACVCVSVLYSLQSKLDLQPKTKDLLCVTLSVSTCAIVPQSQHHYAH